MARRRRHGCARSAGTLRRGTLALALTPTLTLTRCAQLELAPLAASLLRTAATHDAAACALLLCNRLRTLQPPPPAEPPPHAARPSATPAPPAPPAPPGAPAPPAPTSSHGASACGASGSPSAARPWGEGLPPGWKRRSDFGVFKGYRG